MRELKVLGNGHLKLNRAECKEFFTEELEEMVRSQLKRLIEEALLVERDRYLHLGHYEHAPVSRLDFRNGFYFRDLVTKLGVLCRLRVPRTRKGFRAQFLPRYQRRQQAVNNLILQAFLRGISRARWGQCSNRCWGKPARRKPSRASPAGSTTPWRSSIAARCATITSISSSTPWSSRFATWRPKFAAARCWWLTACFPTANAKSSTTSWRREKAKPPGWSSCRIFFFAGWKARTYNSWSPMAARACALRCRWFIRASRSSCAGHIKCATLPAK